MPSKAPGLDPRQVCFVVDDVPAAVDFCEQHLGWGPFFQFKAPIENATYKQWRGEKLTEVALGMAGGVQVEFLHVHKGKDTTADYQAQYGKGFQHLGIHCDSRDEALAHLQSIGGVVNEENEYPGIRFAFVDVPTGPGMFEILQPTAEMADNSGISNSRKSGSTPLFEVDRATIVTHDIKGVLEFYAASFGWDSPQASQSTLSYGNKQTTAQRYVGKAGALELEFIQPTVGSDDPYSAHLRRGTHGLIHAGGILDKESLDVEVPLEGDVLNGEWLDSGETFSLHNWLDIQHSFQTRRSI